MILNWENKPNPKNHKDFSKKNLVLPTIVSAILLSVLNSI